jgi:hypothetical protein
MEDDKMKQTVAQVSKNIDVILMGVFSRKQRQTASNGCSSRA